MRLHHLDVQAFQAFAGRERVDFDALSGAGLFLLHGETGAGKTTLLDAVVFAFYGELPGARGRDARVRSDHADPGLRTEVALEATVRGERIRIVRTPKQERRKQRGEGLVEDAATVRLEAIEPDGTVRVLATRREEAGLELTRLLGMTREQFCQVVLLPQGEFATFLRAESDAREKLLEQLFSAGRFRGAEQWLADRRKEAVAALESSVRSLRDVVAAVVEAADVEAPPEWEADPTLLTAWLDDVHVVAEAELVAARAHETAAAEALAAAERAAREGADLADRRRRHDGAVAALAAQEARRPERDAWAIELDRATVASAVEPLLTVLDEQRRAVAVARAALDELGIPADADVAALRAQVAEAQRRSGEIAALRATEESLATRRAELAALRERLVDAHRRAEAARTALAGGAEARAALVAAVEAAQAAAATQVAVEREAADAAARGEAATRRDGARLRVTTLTDERRVAIDAEQVARQRWLDLRERRLAGMAAELAAGLVDGEPCAVCGSTEHPAPTTAPGGTFVTAEDERTAQTAADGARGAREELDAALEQERATLAAASATAGEDPADLLRIQADAAAAHAAEVAQRAAGAPVAVAALTAHDETVDAHTRTLSEAEQTAAALDAQIAGREEALTADGAALARALDGVPTVAARLAALDAEAAAAERGAAALEALATAARDATRGAQRAATAALEAGFSDIDVARAAVRDGSAREALAARVRDYDAEVTRCRALASDPQLLAAAAALPPDVPTLTAVAARAADAANQATGATAVAGRRAERLDTQRTALADRLAVFGPAAERAARVRSLSHLVDGTSPQNRKRMRLSAYVLAARLEEIAAAASVRLAGMSGGRYALEHRDEGVDGRRRAGLGLVVVDAWTGRERSPRTLSGGETFLASLALALGLADVVAAESGGARLETLFVDEGFGSLDEQTLDEVLDVLDRLREGGRSVGVVSHVAELRHRVTARLHVEKGRHGSHVRQRSAGP